MRILLFLVLALSPVVVGAQPEPEWLRVYTFDESTIEMNTSLLTFISKDVTRVRFRWKFDQPQSLGGVPEVKYKTELEVLEFNCSRNQYRPYHITFFDATGNMARIKDSPGAWQTVYSGSMIEKLFVPACDLIKKKTSVPKAKDDEAQLRKVAEFALHFAQHLEKTKDIKPLIDQYFIANYLDGYLRDQHTNWFLNLNRDTASMVNRQELQRFYVSLMNVGYLNSLYLISQLPADSEGPVAAEKLLPPNVLQLVRNHRYTTQYRNREGDYDFLAENIGSVERLRSYTDLLEGINSLMREHVTRKRAAQSKEWQAMLEEWDLYHPKAIVCGKNCFGLPKGTELFEVNIPVFRLQVAEVSGKLKVVSAKGRF
jgi:hypothetical protein